MTTHARAKIKKFTYTERMALLATEKTRMEHLNQDIDELNNILKTLKSPRNIKYLEKYASQLSKELSVLEQRTKEVAIETNEGYVAMEEDDYDDAGGKKSTTSTATAKQSVKRSLPPPPSTGKWNPITTYGWDQSDKFVTVYVSGLDGVGAIPKENVKCNFEEDAFDLTVKDLNGESYRLNVSNLDKNINVKKSKIKIKAARVNVMLRKVDGKYGPDHWAELRSKKSKESKDRLEKDPSAGIMDLMKDMYNSGDDKMKETIGKAMLESQKKRGQAPDLRAPGGDWGSNM